MMLRSRLLLLLLTVGLVAPVVASAEQTLTRGELQLLPRTFTLSGPVARQRLSLVGRVDAGEADGQVGPIVDRQTYTLRSSDPSVVRIDGSHAVVVGDGKAQIIAESKAGVQSTADVMVEDASARHRWSFRNDVQSVLARQGCNMGACHGALAGKGGFRLSLRGYDCEADFFTITRQAQGRRVELADPGRSLLLAKPTGALPHKGGLRLSTDSHDYKVLSEWIASGAPGPTEQDARLTSISVSPKKALLHPGDRSQILVHGHYDDGRKVDVTHWAKFNSTDESIAAVDEDGLVDIRGSGEGAVLVWFGSQVALARMTVPYGHDVPAEAYVDAPRQNFIDELTLQQLKTLNLRPSPPCSDDVYLRRATLDTIGRLPTQEERKKFAMDASVDRRSQLVERLLASEEFVDYWAYRWSDLLLINGNRLRPAAVKAYYQWLHTAISENRPWDQLVRDILTSKGVSTENGATNFYALHQSPEEMTENACQAFMGLSIGCAKCHNHPLEKWTNDQYYAMANLFSRVRAKGWGGESRNGDGIRTLFVSQQGELIQPTTGRPQPPAPLDAEPIAFNDPRDRREVLAQWMTDSSNPYFARSITNRVWANFFGRGLVEQVDDLRLSNPASNEPLLAAAAQHLIDSRFDLKQLMRSILTSETYQRSSLPLDDNVAESKYLSRYYPRRLMAEVLLDSIDQVLETSTDFKEIAFSGADKQKTDFYPVGTRAIELYDSAVNSYFLKTFGRNPRDITCECERSDEPSMVQVLHLSNGETLNPKLSSESNLIGRLIAEGANDQQVIEALFDRALCRAPQPSEMTRLLEVVSEYQSEATGDGPAARLTALQDVAWSVLTSTEFTFNH